MHVMRPTVISYLWAVLLVLITGAAIASGENFTFNQVSGLQGGTVQGGNYTARFILTAQPGGDSNSGGGNYTADTRTLLESSTQDVIIPLTLGWNLISLPVTL
ncbi:MAG: hypothetical protein V1921_05840 [Candidatus Altiarchaeota archaeon]